MNAQIPSAVSLHLSFERNTDTVTFFASIQEAGESESMCYNTLRISKQDILKKLLVILNCKLELFLKVCVTLNDKLIIIGNVHNNVLRYS